VLQVRKTPSRPRKSSPAPSLILSAKDKTPSRTSSFHQSKITNTTQKADSCLRVERSPHRYITTSGSGRGVARRSGASSNMHKQTGPIRDDSRMPIRIRSVRHPHIWTCRAKFRPCTLIFVCETSTHHAGWGSWSRPAVAPASTRLATCVYTD
jgi:hypothetical protein